MLTLSVRQPWAWAITREATPAWPPPKRWENRAWGKAPGMVTRARALVGQTLALHVSEGGTHAEYVQALGWMAGGRLADPPWPLSSALPRGAIVATFRLAGVARTLALGCRVPLGESMLATCMLCGEVLNGVPCAHADPWAFRPRAGDVAIGLILADVAVLPKPIPIKGGLGFFHVPDAILEGR